MYGDYLKC